MRACSRSGARPCTPDHGGPSVALRGPVGRAGRPAGAHALRGERWDERSAISARPAPRPPRAARIRGGRLLRAWPGRPGRSCPRAAHLEQAVDLRIALRHSCCRCAEFGASSICSARPAPWPIAWTIRPARADRCYTSNYFWLVGDHDAALTASRRAHAIARRSAMWRCGSRRILPRSASFPGRLRRSPSHAPVGTRGARRIEQQRFALSPSSCLASRGRLGLAELAVRRRRGGAPPALEVPGIDRRSCGSPPRWAWAASTSGWGDLWTAVPMLEHGVEVCRRWDLPL